MSDTLTITAKRHGHRRAGMAHAATATEHDAAGFSAAQIAALEADPALVVVRTSAKRPETPAKTASKTPGKGTSKSA